MTSLDDAFALMASLVIDDGRRWGDAATDVQYVDARAVLDADSTTPYHFLTRSRGYAKTDDGAGCAISVMLTQLPPSSRLYGLAADREQGRLLVDSVDGFVSRTPEMTGALTVDSFKVTARRSGLTFEILPADAPGSFGLRPAFLVVDEIAVWSDTEGPRRLFDATTSALAKVPGARCLVLTSPGDPSHFSYRLLEHARVDPLWQTHEVAGPPPWIDAERLEEQRRRLLPSMFARLFEGRWCESEGRLTTLADVRICVGHTGDLPPIGGQHYLVSLDIGLTNDRTAAVVAHAEQRPGGRTVVVDRLGVWRGTPQTPVDLSAVEAWIDEACRAYRAPLVFDPYQAAHLTQRLRSHGVKVQPFTFSQASVGRLAVTMYGLLRDHLLDLPDDDDLLHELAEVRLREVSPGVVRMDHRASGHDDQAIAIALAAATLCDKAPARPASIHTATGYSLSGAFGRGRLDHAVAGTRRRGQRRRGATQITSAGLRVARLAVHEDHPPDQWRDHL